MNPYESPREAKRKGNELSLGDIGFIAVAAVSGLVVLAVVVAWLALNLMSLS